MKIKNFQARENYTKQFSVQKFLAFKSSKNLGEI